MIEGISAITLATHDMRRAVRFYRALVTRLTATKPSSATNSAAPSTPGGSLRSVPPTGFRRSIWLPPSETASGLPAATVW